MARSITKPPLDYDSKTFDSIVKDIENRIKEERILGRAVYDITNPGSDVRTLDVSAATLAQIRDFLGTLVRDLQASGRLGK